MRMTSAREMKFTGSVQGVGFRWTAKRIADSMGLSGWVRNDPDGGVTLALEGVEDELNEFMDRLDQALGCHIAGVATKEMRPGKNRHGFDVVR